MVPYIYKQIGDKMEDEIKLLKLKKKIVWWTWKKDWKVIAVVLWILFMVWAYKTETEQCRSIIEEPYLYCDNYCEAKEQNKWVANQQDFNIGGDVDFPIVQGTG